MLGCAVSGLAVMHFWGALLERAGSPLLGLVLVLSFPVAGLAAWLLWIFWLVGARVRFEQVEWSENFSGREKER